MGIAEEQLDKWECSLDMAEDIKHEDKSLRVLRNKVARKIAGEESNDSGSNQSFVEFEQRPREKGATIASEEEIVDFDRLLDGDSRLLNEKDLNKLKEKRKEEYREQAEQLREAGIQFDQPSLSA